MGQTIGKISRFIFNSIACRITCKDRNSSNDNSTRCSAVVAESEPLIPTTHDSHIISIQTLDDSSSRSSSVLEQSREDRDHRFTDGNDDYFFQANDDKAKVKEITTVTVKKPQVINKEGKWLMHYCSDHRILMLVGEGDFSFTASLAKAFGSAANMVATSLDSLVVAESEPLIPTTHDSHIISIQTFDDDSSCSSSVLDQQSREDRDHGFPDDNTDFFKANDEEVTFTTVTVEKPQVIKKELGKWIMHYCSDHRILLVGEGDFSFSACLAKAFGSAANMVATSLDSLDFLEKNYPSVKTNIGYLRRRGGILLHDMDATKMASHSIVNEYIYDRIIFNFPLAGFFNESKRQQLMRNRKLLRAFMENAKKLLASDGEIHITHKSSATYKEWGLEELGKQCRLRLIEDVEYRLNHYPLYHNKYGFGGNEDFHCYPSRTYKFGHK